MPQLGYIIDDGGNGADGLTWATAYPNLPARIAAHAIVAGDIDVIGHNSVDAFAYSANHTYVLPTASPVYTCISVTQGTGSIAGGLSSFVPLKGTALQINPAHTTASYTATFDGAGSFRGVMFGGNIMTFSPDTDEGILELDHCTFKPGHNGYLSLNNTNNRTKIINPIIDCGNDTGAANSYFLRGVRSPTTILGGSVVNASNRSTGFYALNDAWAVSVEGMDLTGPWSGTFGVCTSVSNNGANVTLKHCKMPSTWDAYLSAGFGPTQTTVVKVISCSDGNNPEAYREVDGLMKLKSATGVYRTGGATVEAVPFSWGGPTGGIETSAIVSLYEPTYTPWIPVVFLTTGLKTVVMHLTMDATALKDHECWMEIMYKAASTGLWTYATTRTAITGAGTTLATSSESWNGATPSFTNKLQLSKDITVGQTGMGKVRIGIGKASIAATDYLYICPQYGGTAVTMFIA